MKKCHQLLTENAASVENALGSGHNRYLGIILLPEQYSRIAVPPFILLTDLVITVTVPIWTLPVELKRIL